MQSHSPGNRAPLGICIRTGNKASIRLNLMSVLCNKESTIMLSVLVNDYTVKQISYLIMFVYEPGFKGTVEY